MAWEFHWHHVDLDTCIDKVKYGVILNFDDKFLRQTTITTGSELNC